jgi:hypothetical protein
MHHYRGLVVATLNSNEGASMLADLAIGISEGADEEELFISIAVFHGAQHKDFELPGWAMIAIPSKSFDVLEGPAPAIRNHKVLEKGQCIAIVHLATHNIIRCLLHLAKCQPMHLIPRYKDGVAKDVVDGVDEAIINREGHLNGRLEPEVVLEEDLILIIESAIGLQIEVAGQVALTLIETCHAGGLLSQIDSMTLSRTRAALGPLVLAGLLLGGYGCNNLL